MKEYKDKNVEWRKLWLIDKFFSLSDGRVIDIACGPGEYGQALAKKFELVYAIEKDKDMAQQAMSTGYYASVERYSIRQRIPCEDKAFDAVWCSEFLEHMPDLSFICELKRIARHEIILTLPNPWSPHYKEDPTHILKYSVSELKRYLKEMEMNDMTLCANGLGRYYEWKVQGLGFDDIPAPLFVKKLTTYALWYLPWLSPTVAVIGRKNDRRI